MNVREATPADTETVIALFASMEWDRPWPRPESGAGHLEGKLVLVAEDEGEIAGFAFGREAHHGHAHLQVACVRPQSRRQGVMTALLKEFAARAKAAGSEHVTLDVDTTNDVGRAVWERLGFREYSRRLFTTVEQIEQHPSEPTGESRVTGADPARVRAIVRTAASPDELPPAPELLQQIAELLGLSG